MSTAFDRNAATQTSPSAADRGLDYINSLLYSFTIPAHLQGLRSFHHHDLEGLIKVISVGDVALDTLTQVIKEIVRRAPERGIKVITQSTQQTAVAIGGQLTEIPGTPIAYTFVSKLAAKRLDN